MPQISQSQKDSRKETILAAARKLLVRHNFDDVSMAAIAVEAGVAKGTLFLYFKTKEELFSAVYLHLFEELGGKYEKLLAEQLLPQQLLRKTILTIISHLDNNRDFTERFRAGRFNTDETTKKMAQTRGANMGRLVRILEICTEGGLLEPFDIRYEASAMFGLCRSALMHKRITGRTLTSDECADRIMHILLHGVGKK